MNRLGPNDFQQSQQVPIVCSLCTVAVSTSTFYSNCCVNMCQHDSSGLLDLNSASRLCARITWQDKVSLIAIHGTYPAALSRLPQVCCMYCTKLLYHCRKMSQAALWDPLRYAQIWVIHEDSPTAKKQACLPKKGREVMGHFERWLTGCNQRMRASCTHWSR